MISDPEGISAGDATELAEAKPKAKARKKKAAEPAEVTASETTVEVAPAVVATEAKKPKSARKSAAKKAAPTEAPVEVPVADEPIAKPAGKKGSKKKVAKETAEEPILAPVESNSEPAQAVPTAAFPKPEPKLERLQKILAKAGIASRRKAEELIAAGQVQINGKVVTELGTKADPERDHVRVDGKLLQGPERIRYFVLNKPKGFVTTVSDPEGRPTVMQFFATERERLYPVGRLDYLSEGLLLVTNDGELANKLTKAASGVEKTYLVKVAGQPTEDMLDVLRSGVVIERGRPGENTGRVRTAPAKIRQVRQGDNPWYEVIIIEGRNRELRKMFEEIGHHVEKIRRVGYGPLILDLEPGKLRELEPEEVQSLRLAAEGKLKKKGKKSAAAGQLPTVAGRAVRYKKPDGKPAYEPRVKARPEFQVESKAEFKPAIRSLSKAAFKPTGKPEFKPKFEAGFKKEFKPAARIASRPASGPAGAPESRPPFRPEGKRFEGARPEGKPAFKSASKPSFKPDYKPDYKPRPKPDFKAAGRPAFGAKQRGNRPPEPPVTEFILPPRKAGPIEPESDFEPRSGHQGAGFNPDYKPGFRTGSGTGSGAGSKPAFRSDRPGSKPAFRAERTARPASPRGEGTRPLGRYNAADDDYVPRKTPGFRVEPVADSPDKGKPRADRSRSGGFDRPGAGGGKPFRPAGARPSGSDSRPARPFRPRPEGAGTDRPRDSKSFGAPKKFAGKPFGAKKFDAARSSQSPAPGGSNSVPKVRLGPDAQPRVKERHRNSFTGKNKGRPKPKSE